MTARHRNGHHSEQNDVVRNQQNEDWDHLDNGGNQSRHELIEALEQQTEFDRLITLPLLEAKENAHHHRPHQDDWDDSANQKTHDRYAEEQPILLLDERPTFLDALHWRDNATAKLDKVCVHEFSSVDGDI